MSIFLAACYWVFGLGFAAELCIDNPQTRSWGSRNRAIVWILVLIFWPVAVVFMLGIKLAEVLR